MKQLDRNHRRMNVLIVVTGLFLFCAFELYLWKPLSENNREQAAVMQEINRLLTITE